LARSTPSGESSTSRNLEDLKQSDRDFKEKNEVDLAVATHQAALCGYVLPHQLGAKSAMPSILSAQDNRRGAHKGRSKGGGLPNGIGYKEAHVFAKAVRTGFDNKPYNVFQTITLQTITSSTSIPTFFNQAWSLGNLDQATQLEAVFDQYRIVLIEVTFIPEVQLVTAGTADVGLIKTVLDYDDSNNLTSEVRQMIIRIV